MKKYTGKYILLVEGSVPVKGGGVYCCIAGKTAEDDPAGSRERRGCGRSPGAVARPTAAFRARNPIPTGATPVHKLISQPVINVPGCPPIADVMTGVVTHVLRSGSRTRARRPGPAAEFYSRRVHDTCYRRAYYDAGLFVESWDDEKARKGLLPLQDGLPRSGDLQRLLRDPLERGRQLSRSSPATDASAAAKPNFWDNGRSIST